MENARNVILMICAAVIVGSLIHGMVNNSYVSQRIIKAESRLEHLKLELAYQNGWNAGHDECMSMVRECAR